MAPSPFLRRALVLAALGGAQACKDETSVVVPSPVDAAFVSVSAGVLHTCGVTTTSHVYCWGWNRDGELGDGSTSDNKYPKLVLGDVAFMAVAAGGGHTCGVARDGRAYCWGFNLTGQLGDGTTQSHASPGSVSGGLPAALVEAGGAFTCAIAADSSGYCWGWGGTGQLGASPPETCATNTGNVPCSRTPLLVAGIRLIAISTGIQHACGVAVDSIAYCWGRNDFGQLGDSSTVDTQTPVAVRGGRHFKTVTVGFQHSCGLTAVGEAFCWGDNALGQLGDTLVTASVVPNRVTGSLSFTSLSAGATYTCGITAAGEGYCWGNDASGQLGSQPVELCVSASGALPCTRTPAAVSGGLTFAIISAATQHTCGVTSTRVMFCWGFNDRGQLGNGTTVGSVAPVRVANQP